MPQGLVRREVRMTCVPVGGGPLEVGVRVEYSLGGAKVGIEEGCRCLRHRCHGEPAHRRRPHERSSGLSAKCVRISSP